MADEHIQRTTVQGDVDGIKRGRTFDVAKANLESNIQRYTNDIDNFCRPDIDALNDALTQATNNFNASGTWDPLASEAEYDAVSKFLNSIQNAHAGRFMGL